MSQTNVQFTVKLIAIHHNQGGFVCLMDAYTESDNPSQGGWGAKIYVPLANIYGPLTWSMNYLPDCLGARFERPVQTVVVQVERIVRRTAQKVLEDLQAAINCPDCERPTPVAVAEANLRGGNIFNEAPDEWERQCQEWRAFIAAAKEEQ